LLRALGSLPRSFDNKGIRHGKTGGNSVIARSAATRQSRRRSAFLKRQGVLHVRLDCCGPDGPRNDGGLGVGRVVAGVGFIVAAVRQQRYSSRQGGGNSVIARSAATRQSRIVQRGGGAAGNITRAATRQSRRSGFLKRQGVLHVHLDCHGPDGPRNDGGLRVGRVVAGVGFIVAAARQQRYSSRQDGGNSVIARSAATWQSRGQMTEDRGQSVTGATRRK
jgi:hypothetical protein